MFIFPSDTHGINMNLQTNIIEEETILAIFMGFLGGICSFIIACFAIKTYFSNQNKLIVEVLIYARDVSNRSGRIRVVNGGRGRIYICKVVLMTKDGHYSKVIWDEQINTKSLEPGDKPMDHFISSDNYIIKNNVDLSLIYAVAIDATGKEWQSKPAEFSSKK